MALLLLTGPAAAAECAGGALGSLVTVQGVVEVSTGNDDWQVVKLDAVVCTGYLIRVGQSSRAGIYFDDIETVTYVDQNTTTRVADRPAERSLIIELLEGALNFLSREPRSLEIRTPFINAGVKGTEFEVRVSVDRTANALNGRTAINMIDGRVEARAPGDTKILTSGQSGVAAGTCPANLSLDDLRQGAACEPTGAQAIQVTARAPDSVQWALYYPPIAVDPGGVNQLLARGRVDEALPILCGGPAEGEKSALIAIIELTRNDPLRGEPRTDACGRASQRDNRQRALDFAEQAVRMSPNSAASWVALSYARQAYGKLDEAREALEQGVEAEPQNALVHARLAELWLSLGYRDRALDEAATAKRLASNLSRTQTVYGFAALAEIDINRARLAFTTAIQLDSADPLPRLGLGLAKIRDGDIAAGRRELEIAAGLDPQNSLIRSYLGKAYFEEKRGELDAAQFDLAKQLDPNDPTPWLYDSIRLQTENRPVEALHAIQKSIELNDNRAVYRSRLGLDEDAAVRSTSLGRIYQDLGFEQLALVEGSKSLSYNPANYSAHRFVADSYAARPRHEIARSSELLQSQLLQPLNADPVQPQIAETDLNILENIGPADVGFNEFTPLFQHDGLRFSASGLVGNEQTYGDEVVLSGIAGRAAFSFGQFHYQTDGFRPNNDLRHDIYNAFGQLQLNDSFDVQVEFRHRSTQQGDLSLDFDPSIFSQFDDRHIDHDSVRLGTHYQPTPQSHLIASLIYSNRREVLHQVESGVQIDDKVENDGFDGQMQYLFDGELVDLTAGVGFAKLDGEETSVLSFPIPCPLPTCNFAGDAPVTQANGYVYGNINWPRTVQWTIGASYDWLDEDPLNVDSFNPKVGLQWNISPSVRLRAAYFRSLKRALVVEQTLEPTQVAGFSQLFDDFNGTKVETYGAGLDFSLGDDLFAGLEAYQRNLNDVPFVDVFTPSVSFEDERELSARAYLYWTISSDFAFAVEFQYDRFDRDFDVTAPDPRPTDIETIAIPVELEYFSDIGFFSLVRATFVDQSVSRQPVPGVASGHESFVTLDGLLGYRFPGRTGSATLEIRNVLDEDFFYQDLNIQSSEPTNPPFSPARTIVGRVTLNF